MKNELTESANIFKIRNYIEALISKKIRTPKDFVYLSESIFDKTHQYVSPTTLKRIWGYLKESTNTRKSTLNILSEFAGYHDWEDFTANYRELDASAREGLVLGVKYDYTKIKKGNIVDVSWIPESYCRLKCIGDHKFEIEDSANCVLKSGDTVNCYLFMEGEALYFTDLTVNGCNYNAYKVGNVGGVSLKIHDD